MFESPLPPADARSGDYGGHDNAIRRGSGQMAVIADDIRHVIRVSGFVILAFDYSSTNAAGILLPGTVWKPYGALLT